MRVIHDIEVLGAVLDDQTRCEHYNSDLDIIAIRFKCCDHWFPCRECHDENQSHIAEIWPSSEFGTLAVLCGSCGEQLSIDRYLNCSDQCPSCRSSFNPGCATHYHLYFEIENFV